MNMYAYVHNNPVNFYDPMGEAAWVPFVGGAIGMALNGYNNWDALQSGEMTTTEFLSSLALGAATGAMSTFGSGFTAVGIGAATMAANEAGNQYLKYGEINNRNSIVTSGASGAIGAFVGNAGKKIGSYIIREYPVRELPLRPVTTYGSHGAVIGATIGSSTVDYVISHNSGTSYRK